MWPVASRSNPGQGAHEISYKGITQGLADIVSLTSFVRFSSLRDRASTKTLSVTRLCFLFHTQPPQQLHHLCSPPSTVLLFAQWRRSRRLSRILWAQAHEPHPLPGFCCNPPQQFSTLSREHLPSPEFTTMFVSYKVRILTIVHSEEEVLILLSPSRQNAILLPRREPTLYTSFPSPRRGGGLSPRIRDDVPVCTPHDCTPVRPPDPRVDIERAGAL